MATTDLGARLTEAHRVAQLAVRARAVHEVLQIWPALDPDRLDTSWPAVETALLAIAERHHGESAALAGRYFRAFRQAEGTSGTATSVIASFSQAVESRTTTSLRVTGPATIKRLMALHRPTPTQTALVRVSGALSRHVLDGGRETLLSSLRSDRQARGWARIVSGNACTFCSMLASRGAVYSQQTGQFQAHDHCSCSLEPLYRQSHAPTPRDAVVVGARARA